MQAAPGKWLTLNLLCQIALGVLAMSACLPSMQTWVVEFEATQAEVQLTFSFFLIGFALTQLIYGPLSDNFGRRRVLLYGLVIGACGSLAAAMSTSLTMLIAARALQGAGTCAGVVIGRAMVQDYYAGPARTRIMAYVGMALGLCPPLGTVIGGQLHVHFGWRSNFILMIVLSLILFVLAWRGLPGQQPGASQRRSLGSMVGSYAALFREKDYLNYCVIMAGTFSAFYVFLAAAPVVFDSYGVRPESIGFYILLVPSSYILGNLMTSRLVGNMQDLVIMSIGQVFNVVAIVLVLALAFAGIHHPLAVAIPLMLLGLGHGLVVPPSLAGAVGVVPLLAGAAAAMAGMMQQLVSAVGSYLIGFVDHGDARNLAWFMLVFTIVALVAQWPMMRRIRASRA